MSKSEIDQPKKDDDLISNFLIPSPMTDLIGQGMMHKKQSEIRANEVRTA